MSQETPFNLLKMAAGQGLRVEVPVRWGDLDALNHVNNTVYFRYMEEARVTCMRACGIGGATSPRHLVVAHVSCDFLRPVLWPATVLVDTRITKLGRSSIEFQVEIHIKGDDNGACARSRTVIVGVDADTGRSMAWTETELQSIDRVFGSLAAGAAPDTGA